MTRETAIRWVAKPLVFASALIPLAWVAWAAVSSGLGPTGPLGANPIEYINRFLGDWTIRFLLLALAVTDGNVATFTCVAPGDGARIGVDRDADGTLDGDETA